MNYGLAKKLKDAGFVQEHPNYEGKDAWVNIENKHCNNIFSDSIYCPTLSELIEACGYGFRQLTLHSVDSRPWQAKAGKRSGGFLKGGHTPEEAVAKLWLELNQRKNENKKITI